MLSHWGYSGKEGREWRNRLIAYGKFKMYLDAHIILSVSASTKSRDNCWRALKSLASHPKWTNHYTTRSWSSTVQFSDMIVRCYSSPSPSYLSQSAAAVDCKQLQAVNASQVSVLRVRAEAIWDNQGGGTTIVRSSPYVNLQECPCTTALMNYKWEHQLKWQTDELVPLFGAWERWHTATLPCPVLSQLLRYSTEAGWRPARYRTDLWITMRWWCWKK